MRLLVRCLALCAALPLAVAIAGSGAHAQLLPNCPPGQLYVAGKCQTIVNPYNVDYTVKNDSGTVLKVVWIRNGDRTTSDSFTLGKSVQNSFPAADDVIVQVLTYVSNRAGTASGSGFVSEQVSPLTAATHGCWIARSSGWSKMTITVTGTEANVTCKVTDHTVSADPHYAFPPAESATPGPARTPCPKEMHPVGRFSTCVKE